MRRPSNRRVFVLSVFGVILALSCYVAVFQGIADDIRAPHTVDQPQPM